MMFFLFAFSTFMSVVAVLAGDGQSAFMFAAISTLTVLVAGLTKR